jgi:hypothetical protein
VMRCQTLRGLTPWPQRFFFSPREKTRCVFDTEVGPTRV